MAAQIVSRQMERALAQHPLVAGDAVGAMHRAALVSAQITEGDNVPAGADAAAGLGTAHLDQQALVVSDFVRVGEIERLVILQLAQVGDPFARVTDHLRGCRKSVRGSGEQ